jgi:polysaccharide pyruvyl transferase WcaK-like protein
MRKFCILGASFETGNMGVNALTLGTIQSILNFNPNADIKILNYSHKNSSYEYIFNKNKMEIKNVSMRFSKNFFLKNNIALLLLKSLILKVIPFKNLKKNVIKKDSCLKTICDSDVVAAISGGDSFSDIYGLERFIFITLPMFLTIFLERPLFHLPQTIGPFKKYSTKILAKYILKKSIMVCTRDRKNIDELKEVMGKKYDDNKFRFCYDVGFVIDSIRPKTDFINMLEKLKGDDGNLIGINVSGLLAMGGYNKKNLFGLRCDYNKLINIIIKRFLEMENIKIILIPHLYGGNEIEESDETICNKIYMQYRDIYKERIELSCGRYNQNEVKYIIGMCDFFIGSRMHACIAALSQGVPAVAIAYSKKFLGVFESISCSDLVADPRHMNYEEVICLIDETYQDKEKIKNHLLNIMPVVKNQTLNIFESFYDS